MKYKIKNFVLLSTITTLVIHIINRIQFSIHTMKDYLYDKKNDYYDWRFGKIRYIQKGSGNPILLIHDLNFGSSLYEFNKIIEELSKKHEVYAIDLLGYGLSDKPNMTYTTYLYVQLIIDFIKNIIGRKCDIISTGDASPITVMACHNDPEVIHSMIFINPQSFYESNKIPSKQTKILKIIIELPVIGTFIYHLFTNKRSTTKMFQEKYYYNTLNIEEKDILSYLESAHLPDYNAKYVYSSHIGKYLNTNFIHALKEINHSIYIIAGEYETEIVTTVENYIYYNNAIESTYIPFTKHLPHMEKPEKVISHIDMFLTSI